MKRTVCKSMVQFSYKLYDALSSSVDPNSNILFSPMSIYAALAMTYCGSRGPTADEIMSALNISGIVQADFHETFSEIWMDIFKRDARDGSKLNLCNRLWVQKGVPLETEFTDSLTKYYDAPVGDVDFHGNPKSAATAINEWVEEKTNKLIKNVVDENECSGIKLFLVNTIYFKGEWLQPFLTEDTKLLPFHIDPNTTCNVDTMYQKKSFGYTNAEEFDCEVLTVRYKRSPLRMVVILPKEKFGLAKLEQKLQTDGIEKDVFDDWATKGCRTVEVYIPRFEFPHKMDLKKPLHQLGVTKLFDPNVCELGGASKEEMYLSDIVHHTFINVNEEGTEACAVTANTMRTSGLSRPPVFRADHPFLFLIVDNDTECVVFWGRFCNPNSLGKEVDEETR